MYNSEFYTCDICGRPYKGKDAVRNEVYIENGTSTGHYPQVCDKCVRVIGNGINELRPRKENELDEKINQ